MGHGRGAAYGASVSDLLEAAALKLNVNIMSMMPDAKRISWPLAFGFVILNYLIPTSIR